MTMYSVFDLDSQRYDYYQAEGPGLGQRVKLRGRGLSGVTPEDVLPHLPVNALHVGSGRDPRGVIAVRGFGAFGDIATETEERVKDASRQTVVDVSTKIAWAGVAVLFIYLILSR